MRGGTVAFIETREQADVALRSKLLRDYHTTGVPTTAEAALELKQRDVSYHTLPDSFSHTPCLQWGRSQAINATSRQGPHMVASSRGSVEVAR